MKLIADSGSTKTDWILVTSKTEWKQFTTVGYNPYFVDTENIYISLRESLLPHFNIASIEEVYFYGAGCSTPQRKSIVMRALKRAFTASSVIVDHDLLAAARALLQDQSGFASILGTGTNTCIYDGKEITHNIDSLGYLLGDEGSGAYIGRKVLQCYMRRLFDKDLIESFANVHVSENEEIYEALYNSPLQNRYLASYATFAGDNRDHPQIKKLVRESFRDFFKNLVLKYPSYQDYVFNCLGSIGFIFQDTLREVAEAHGMKVGNITQKPIEGLIAFHYR